MTTLDRALFYGLLGIAGLGPLYWWGFCCALWCLDALAG